MARINFQATLTAVGHRWRNKDIRGISVLKNEVEISQYADDTTLIIDDSENFLISCLQVLDNIREISSLRVNCKKTEALWI